MTGVGVDGWYWCWCVTSNNSKQTASERDEQEKEGNGNKCNGGLVPNELKELGEEMSVAQWRA
jgi:hypothetical protein